MYNTEHERTEFVCVHVVVLKFWTIMLLIGFIMETIQPYVERISFYVLLNKS